MDNLLPPIPLHLATLGMLDGQIGMATLGYIVGPDIVSRFPAEGVISAEAWIAVVSEQGDLIAQLEACEWLGVVDSPLDLDGIVESLAWRAAVQEDDLGGDIAAEKPYTGNVAEEDDHQADVEERDDFIAEVVEIDGAAEVSECDQVAEVTEKPGEGRCR
jgi:hypothetical protein